MKWITVKDQNWPDDVPILLCDEDSIYFRGYECFLKLNGKPKTMSIIEFKYWMPLPELPKADK